MPSKFFRVATEGDTTDGRVITGAQIKEMAETYNPATYGARVWLEHMRGLLPDGPFKALGDVIAVKAEQVDGKWTLFAQIDPTDDLKAINKARQKIYSSIELAINFARTGKAYLMGLGVTDSPASLGTDMLVFSGKSVANPLGARKLEPDNLFTAAQEVVIEWEDETDAPSDGARLFTKIKNLLLGAQKKAADEHAHFSDDIKAAITAIAESQKDVIAGFASLRTEVQLMEEMSGRLETLQQDLEKQANDFKTLRDDLDKTPSTPPRAPVSGANGDYAATDC